MPKAKSRRFPAPAEDASRIVPLHAPRGDQPMADGALLVAPRAQLTYRGGPLLTAVEIFTIFWGVEWTKKETASADEMNAFFDFLLTSPLIDQLAEYDVPGQSIGHGTRTGTIRIASPAPATSVSDTAIRAFLRKQLAAKKKIPAPTPNSLYLLFLPPGVRVSAFGSLSCQSFCGYHDAIDKKIFYAVMPFPGCSGCRGGGIAMLDALTETSSHELCEAITDPIPGHGWYDDHNGEIGDICAWQSRMLGQYTIQREWSNKAGRCV